MRFLMGVPFVITPAQTLSFAEAPPPAWATAGLLLLTMAALCLALRRVRRRPALTRSGEAARRRLGLADASIDGRQNRHGGHG